MKKIIGILVLCVICVSTFLLYPRENIPLVSVVMPIYNRPDLAPRSIESILNQTFADFEFIIVDDGSDEETKKLLKEYARKDKRIKLIHNPQNRGIAYSRQRGLEKAKGTYVAIMDSDDWSVPDRLEKSVAFMTDYPEVDVMTGGLASIQENEFIPNYIVKNPVKYSTAFLPGFFEVELMFYNIFPNVASFFKREFVEKKYIKYDANLVSAEDYDFWYQFAINNAKMASISDVLVYVRRHTTNASSYYKDMGINSINIHRKAFGRFFKPNKQELKFEYTTKEKCEILKKMKEANLKNQIMPQILLENRYNARCPIDLEQSYYLVHNLNKWQGYLEQIDDTTWERIETNTKCKVDKIGDNKIQVHWEGYPKEEFEHQPDGTWSFIIKGEKITLKHINWADDLMISHNNKGCRVKVPTECAEIKKIADDTIWINWRTAVWADEEFKKNDEGVYEFVRELNEKEFISGRNEKG